MGILSAAQLNYSIGVEDILKDVCFNVEAGDRVGIVGVNGAGKSTLLKLIIGAIDKDAIAGGDAYEKDSGEISIARDKSVAYLKQREHFNPGVSVWDAVDSKIDPAEFEEQNGYSLEKGKRGILTSLGFRENTYEMEAVSLSGGEQTRLALGAVLLRQPDILLLDEPTNHLDISTLSWLEGKLKSYKGTLLIVSHDRYFLDRVCTRIFEIENKKLTAYNGNYSQYKEKKQIKYEEDLKHYLQQESEIKRQEEIIRRFKEHNTEHLVKRAQSREKRLAMVERLEKPVIYKDEIKLCFKQNLQTGNDVVILENLGFAYDDSKNNPLFTGLNAIIKKGDRVCITGANGVGKTTLLKMLMGKLRPTEGRIKLGTNVALAYYDQQQENLNPDNTVLEEVYNCPGIIIGPGEYARIESRYTQTELRKILGAFCFRGDDVLKKVGELAGGEKARLSLLKLMMSGANVLVLDEPTNHLDIASKEIFEDALLGFPGTEIIVSHDRYLIDKVGTKGIELLSASESIPNSKSSAPPANVAHTSAEEERQAKKRAETERRRLERLRGELEAKIAELETSKEKAEADLCSPEVFSNPAKAAEISARLEEIKLDLDSLYEKWMEIC